MQPSARLVGRPRHNNASLNGCRGPHHRCLPAAAAAAAFVSTTAAPAPAPAPKLTGGEGMGDG